jgi:hypothetical protein
MYKKTTSIAYSLSFSLPMLAQDPNKHGLTISWLLNLDIFVELANI